MGKKIGLLCLSVMVVALAVGCSTNRNNTNRANVTANESAKENRSEERTKREDEDESSIDTNISVGASATVYKNIFDTKNKVSQEKVTITLDNVIRGTEAKEIVDNYNTNNPTSKIPHLINDSLEYVIIEYTLTLPENIKDTKYGQSSHIGIDICNLDGSKLQSDNVNYLLRVANFEKTEGLKNTESGITRAVITLPKNVTEFIIKLGDNPEDMASYIIN
ncbi:hypothetical protein ABFP60_15405 [Clostridioides difficile]